MITPLLTGPVEQFFSPTPWQPRLNKEHPDSHFADTAVRGHPVDHCLLDTACRCLGNRLLRRLSAAKENQEKLSKAVCSKEDIHGKACCRCGALVPVSAYRYRAILDRPDGRSRPGHPSGGRALA